MERIRIIGCFAAFLMSFPVVAAETNETQSDSSITLMNEVLQLKDDLVAFSGSQLQNLSQGMADVVTRHYQTDSEASTHLITFAHQEEINNFKNSLSKGFIDNDSGQVIISERNPKCAPNLLKVLENEMANSRIRLILSHENSPETAIREKIQRINNIMDELAQSDLTRIEVISYNYLVEELLTYAGVIRTFKPNPSQGSTRWTLMGAGLVAFNGVDCSYASQAAETDQYRSLFETETIDFSHLKTKETNE